MSYIKKQTNNLVSNNKKRGKEITAYQMLTMTQLSKRLF